jgi:hypothetical protein
MSETKPKKPKNKYHPLKGKEPRLDDKNNPDHIFTKKPSWRFSKMDMNGYLGCHHIKNRELLLQIREKLISFESMTWGEIEKKRNPSGGKQNHPMPIYKISHDAQDRLKELRIIDIDEIYSLHLQGTEKIK